MNEFDRMTADEAFEAVCRKELPKVQDSIEETLESEYINNIILHCLIDEIYKIQELAAKAWRDNI